MNRLTNYFHSIQRNGTFILCAILTLSFISPYAFANPNSAADQEEVELRVARLALIEGQVKILRISDDDWTEGMINVPLMAGDQVYTGPGGRAEIELEDGAILWMDSNTHIKFTFLDSGLEQIEVKKGTISIGTQPWDYERPSLQIIGKYFTTTIMEHTKARYDVQEEGPALINVWRGQIRAVRDQESHFRINKGNALVVRKSQADTYTVRANSKPDEFDHWVDIRDSIHSSSQSQQYISKRISGYSDLDRHGEWVKVAEYGRVWRPHITVSDWAPYRYGYWSYREPYGRVWISNESWGWVPYHYGRWVYVDHYDWVWVPKDVHVVHHHHHHYRRPIWYPHLVSFAYADRGSYFHFSVGHGHYRHHHGHYVGWFPLGPRDHYYGHYRHRYAYVDRSDHYYDYRGAYIDNSVTNITNINYQNSNVQNAITVVPRDEFAPQKPAREAQYAAATIPEQNLDKVNVGRSAIDNLPNENQNSEPSSRNSRIRLTREKEPSIPTTENLNTLASSKQPQRETGRSVDSRSVRGEQDGQASTASALSQARTISSERSRSEQSFSTRDTRAPKSEDSRSSQVSKSARESSPQNITPSNASKARPEAPRSNVSSGNDQKSTRYSGLTPSSSSGSRNSVNQTEPQRPRSLSPSRSSDSGSQPSVSPSRSNSSAFTPFNRNERIQTNQRPVSRPRSSNLSPEQRSSRSSQPVQIQKSPSRTNPTQSGSRPSSSNIIQRAPNRSTGYEAPRSSSNRPQSSFYSNSLRSESDRSSRINTPSRSTGRVYSTQPSRSSNQNSTNRSYSPSRSSSSNQSSYNTKSNRSSGRVFTLEPSTSRSRSSYQSSESRSPTTRTYSSSPSTSSPRSYSPSQSNNSSRSYSTSRSSGSTRSYAPSRSTSSSRSYSSPSTSRSSRSFSSSSSSRSSQSYSPSRSSSSTRSYTPSRSSSSSRSYSPSRSSSSSRSFSTSSSRSSSSGSMSAPRSSSSRSSAPRASSRTSSPR